MGPLQPLTMGLVGLVKLFKKVHALGSYLFRGKHVGMCVCSNSFILLTNSPIFLAMEAVELESKGLYVEVSARCELPSDM